MSISKSSKLHEENKNALELIAHQGWFNILKDPTQANLKQMQEFYKYFKAVVPLLPNKPSVQSQFLWDGEEQYLHTRDLAIIIKIEPSNPDSLKIHQKRNWVDGSEIIVGKFGEQVAKQRRKKDQWFVSDLPIHLRIIHAVIVTSIIPRSAALDRVNPANGEIMWEVKNRRKVDTAQIILFGMQTASTNTREKLVMPHLLNPILKHFRLSHTMEDAVEIGTLFLPSGLENFIFHGNLAYVSPPPPLQKTLKIKGAPLPKTGPSQDLLFGSLTLRPGLMSGDALHTNQSLHALNDKMGVLVGTMSEMRGDLKRLSSSFKEFVLCFKELILVLIDKEVDSEKDKSGHKEEDVDVTTKDRQSVDPEP